MKFFFPIIRDGRAQYSSHLIHCCHNINTESLETSTLSVPVLLHLVLQLSVLLSSSLSPNPASVMLGKGSQNGWWETLIGVARVVGVCVHIFCAYWALPQRAVTGMMDRLVTCVDLAETAGRYSFQLTGLHWGEKAKELKQERRRRSR